MTWFKKWWPGRSGNASTTSAVERPDEVQVALEATEDEGFFDKYVVAEKTRFGDPWIVVSPKDEVGSKDEFFDVLEDPLNFFDKFDVIERTRLGDPWVVVCPKNEVEIQDLDFFDDDENIQKLTKDVPVYYNKLYDNAVFLDNYTITERTRFGDSWIIVHAKNDKINFEDDFFDEVLPSKYLITERTRFGDPWIVVHLKNDTDLLDEFFDSTWQQNAFLQGSEFFVTERRRSGEIWIVVEHATQQDLKLSCDYCEEDDFFDKEDVHDNTKCTISDLSDNLEARLDTDGIAQNLIDSLEYIKEDLCTSTKLYNDLIKSKEGKTKATLEATECQFVITERTRAGDTWIVVDHIDSRLPVLCDFFDLPPQPDALIPNSQLVVTQRTRLGEPWLVIDLPAAGCSKTASEDNAFFDLLPISSTNGKDKNWLGKNVEKLKKKTKAPILNLQEYFHLNDSGDLRVINFGVKVHKGWDSCTGPWKWWYRIPVAKEAKEKKRTFFTKLMSRFKRFWRKYGNYLYV